MKHMNNIWRRRASQIFRQALRQNIHRLEGRSDMLVLHCRQQASKSMTLQFWKKGQVACLKIKKYIYNGWTQSLQRIPWWSSGYRLPADFIAESPGWIPAQGTKIPWTAQWGQKIKTRKNPKTQQRWKKQIMQIRRISSWGDWSIYPEF